MKEQFKGIRNALGISETASKGTNILLPKYFGQTDAPSGPLNTLPVVSQVHQAGSTQGQCLNSFTLVNRH